MRVVLDINVLISALIRGGKPRRLLGILSGREHVLVVSESIIAELSRVSADEKIKRYMDDGDIAVFLGTILSVAAFVKPKSAVKIFGNPDDDILAAANEGNADLIVTGDKHILELGDFERTKIVTVAKALSMLERK